MSTIFRPATAADIPAITDIECRAFGRDTRESREFKQRELQHELPDYVVLADAGQLVASARIQRHWLQVGQCAVLKGDVGHVAVTPEAQGRGYGTTLMQHIIPKMRENGFHLSRLGGLMKFYRRFGYEPFLRRYVHLTVQPFDADMKGSPWGEYWALTAEEQQAVRRYDPSLDALAVHELRQCFNGGRCGHLLLSDRPPGPTTAGPSPDGYDFVYEHQGKVMAFLRGALGLVNAGDPAPSYRLDDLWADYDHPEAVGPLVKRLAAEANKIAPTMISCRLPYDEWLVGALTDARIQFELSEWHQSVDGNMMRVVNLPGCLQACLPELNARLQEAGTPLWQGRVKLRLPEEEAVLVFGDGEVAVEESGDTEVTLQPTQADFIKWLLGIVGFGESWHVSQPLTGPQRLALSVLFPRRPCASGVWG